MSRRVVPVSRLVRYIKEYMDSDPVLHGVMIEGEISNLRVPNSGHWYFSLKDEKASLTCAMFAYQNRKVTFQPKNGDKVILIGDVTVYESMGSMQMVASSMQPSGIGELYLKFEELKRKLYQEGLFEESHKKRLPKYPMDIALVTGSNTAARKDVLITFQKRWPIARITEYPAPVQGIEASNKIIEALKKADEGNHELVILARGGGSLEDLWCFNDEALSRFIYQMHTPIITGIGHETDTTLVDYVSDIRANTPTGAVEVGTPDLDEVSASLDQYQIRYVNAMNSRIQKEKKDFEHYANASVLKNPYQFIQEKIVKVQFLSERLLKYQYVIQSKRNQLDQLLTVFHQQMNSTSRIIRNELKEQKTELIVQVHKQLNIAQNGVLINRDALYSNIDKNKNRYTNNVQNMIHLLDAYSPLKVLSRGYSVTYKDNHVVKDINEVDINDTLTVRLSNGTVITKVEDKKDDR